MPEIELKNISKNFKIGFKKNQSFLSRILSILGKESQKTVRAVDNVSFSLVPNEIIGIMGSNGSGKSTLLRTMAGIYKHDGGLIETNGKIVSLIGLVPGFKDRLTMRENIFLVGAFFELSAKEVKIKFNSIVEFSGLEKFVETKLYQFSSGMMERLAFSIAVHAKPDILLLDEVFEVGDPDFKRKSALRIIELARGGCIVVLVSHNPDLVKKYCTRAIFMSKGRVINDGSPQEVINAYINFKPD